MVLTCGTHTLATGLNIPEPAQRALGLTAAGQAEAALTPDTPVFSDSSADALIMPDLLTIAWMAGTSGPDAHNDARRLLAQARACLPGKGEDATRAYVRGREGEEAAALGNKAAKGLIRRAAEAFAQARPQRERPWVICLSQAHMSALELSTYTRLGDEQKVHELADDLLATVTPASKRAVVVYADLGIAAVRLGDVSNDAQRLIWEIRIATIRIARHTGAVSEVKHGKDREPLMRRTKVTVAAIACGLTLLAGCSGSPTRPRHHAHHHSVSQASVFTFAEGQQVCRDVAAWYPRASNAAGSGEQFTPALQQDETLAGNSQLGMALLTMDGDDQPGNYTWWMAGPGSPSDYGVVQQICANTYGVTLPSPSA